MYVEDTTRRILEANRCMAQLELRSRYRLRSRRSNMVVQVCDDVLRLTASTCKNKKSRRSNMVVQVGGDALRLTTSTHAKVAM